MCGSGPIGTRSPNQMAKFAWLGASRFLKDHRFEGPLKGGVSVKCRGQIFYSFGCQLENHNVECRLGIITILSVGVGHFFA